MKLTSIKWWYIVVWFNYQYFVCCNGNTCQPCQPNLATFSPESSVSRTDNDIWIGFLAGYGHSKVGIDICLKLLLLRCHFDATYR